jgi:anthranilate synthase component 1
MPTTPKNIAETGPTCDLKTYRRLAMEANWIPVWTTVPADLLTPVSAFWKLTHQTRFAKNKQTSRAREESYSFLFESVEGGESIARFTFLGTGSLGRRSGSAFPLIVKYWIGGPRHNAPHAANDPAGKLGRVEIWEPGTHTEQNTDFISVAREKFRKFIPARVEGLPPLTAGAVGYMNYDVISLHEPVKLPPAARASEAAMPDAVLMLFSTLLVFDHVKHQIWIVHNKLIPPHARRSQIDKLYESAIREVASVVKALESSEHPPANTPSLQVAASKAQPRLPLKSNIPPRQFLAAVRKAQEYIKAGDIFQVVLSRRLETKVRSHPFEIYRALRRVNPAPYLFYLQMGADCVLGSSPEMLVKVTDGEIEYRPIAGTRKRGATPEEDEALEKELLADEKELAEHTMLVDLGRNDVGRVARYGTVRPTKLKFIERYSHVMHMVSSVEGKLRPELDAWDALVACFPAGTVTGAPKVRAMQIISELEPTRRGIYAGTVFYYDLTGNLNSCIAIRSIVIRDGKAIIQVGAGIVADSVPELEFQETINKGRAMWTAISLAEQQFENRFASGARQKKYSAGKRQRK